MTKILNIKMILILVLNFSSFAGLVGCIEIKKGGGDENVSGLNVADEIGGAEGLISQIGGLAFVKNPDLENDDLPVPFTPNNFFAKTNFKQDVNGDTVFIDSVEVILTPDQGTLAVTGSAHRAGDDPDTNPELGAPVAVELLGRCEVSMAVDNQAIQELQGEIAKIKLCQTVKASSQECANPGTPLEPGITRLPLELSTDDEIVRVSSFVCEMKSVGDAGFGLCEDAEALKAKVEQLAAGLISGCHSQIVSQ